MKIELRPYDDQDIIPLASLANHPAVSKHLRNTFPSPCFPKDAAMLIQSAREIPMEKGIELAIIVNDYFAGAISLLCYHDIYQYTADLGYWLGEPFWGQGIMQQVVAVLIPYAFSHLAIHKIHAEVFVSNIASQRVLEKNNFIKEGLLQQHVYKQQQYHDIYVYGLIKKE